VSLHAPNCKREFANVAFHAFEHQHRDNREGSEAAAALHNARLPLNTSSQLLVGPDERSPVRSSPKAGPSEADTMTITNN